MSPVQFLKINFFNGRSRTFGGSINLDHVRYFHLCPFHSSSSFVTYSTFCGFGTAFLCLCLEPAIQTQPDIILLLSGPYTFANTEISWSYAWPVSDIYFSGDFWSPWKHAPMIKVSKHPEKRTREHVIACRVNNHSRETYPSTIFFTNISSKSVMVTCLNFDVLSPLGVLIMLVAFSCTPVMCWSCSCSFLQIFIVVCYVLCS